MMLFDGVRAGAALLLLASGCTSVLGANFDRQSGAPRANDGGADDAFPEAVAIDAASDVQTEDATARACDGTPKAPGDALRWELEESGYSKTLFGVWGSGCGDVYAIGEDGVVLHSGGSGKWQSAVVAADTFFGLWASGPSDVYAVGNGATIRHFDGVEWQPQTSATGEYLTSVVGTGSKNLFISGSAGAVQHSTGDGTWTIDRPAPAPENYIGHLWISPNGAVYGVGDNGKIVRRWGANDWRDEPSNLTKNLRGVWGSAADDIFVVGDSGTILHSTGNGQWAVQVSGTTHDLYRAWGTEEGDRYVIGRQGTIAHSSGNGAWTRQANGLTAADFYGIWSTKGGDVWVVGANGTIVHGR